MMDQRRQSAGPSRPQDTAGVRDSLYTEESTFWNKSAHLLCNSFPNPERNGCPPAAVLRRIACGGMPLNDAAPWMEHLGSCSPCYRDFVACRQAARIKRSKKLLQIAFAVAAVLLLFLGVIGLTGILHQMPAQQISILDLGSIPTLRGTETPVTAAQQPLLLNLDRPEVEIRLPIGSAEGIYEIEIVRPETREIILKTAAAARIADHKTILRTRLNASLPSGNYQLGVRREDADWSYYSLLAQ